MVRLLIAVIHKRLSLCNINIAGSDVLECSFRDMSSISLKYEKLRPKRFSVQGILFGVFLAVWNTPQNFNRTSSSTSCFTSSSLLLPFFAVQTPIHARHTKKTGFHLSKC